MSSEDRVAGQDPLARCAHLSNLTLGDTVLEELQAKGTAIPERQEDAHFHNFIHALNTSDWVGAASFLYAGESQTLKSLLQADASLISMLGHKHLTPLYRAANWFDKDRDEWRGQVQEIYLFGKLPLYGPNMLAGQPGPNSYIYKEGVAQQSGTLTGLINIFHEYDRINQLYQKPATTTAGAPIRYAQGHNWTYAHARLDLANQKLFPENKQRVLMNWDAHRDLGAPFLHLSREMATMREFIPYDKNRLLELIQNAKTKEELIEVTVMVNIAGWILPLLYSKEFETEDISELIIVLPKEAMQTSKRSYWPKYGSFETEVGQIVESAVSLNQEGQPGNSGEQDEFKGVQSVSKDLWFQSVHPLLAHYVKDKTRIKIHIIDADNTSDILDRVADRNVYLSVDVDYTGAIQPGGHCHEANHNPHYPLNKTPEEEARHLELIDRFGDFYRRAADRIRAVSIANSPDFTADETRRRPAARIMSILTGDDLIGQPNWLLGETSRVEPPKP